MYKSYRKRIHRLSENESRIKHRSNIHQSYNLDTYDVKDDGFLLKIYIFHRAASFHVYLDILILLLYQKQNN